MNNTKISGRVTSEVVSLNVWITLVATCTQRRETARVLALRGVPAEPDIDPARASTQGILSDFWLIFKILRGVLLLKSLKLPGWRLALGRYRDRSGHLASQIHERFLGVGQQ